MSNSSSTWDAVAIWVVSAFIGLVAFGFTQSIFMLLFAPVIVGVVWNSTNRMRRLEERLSQLEARLSVGQSGASGEHVS